MPKKLDKSQISIPEFSFTYPKAIKSRKKLTLFELSSHNRAREAIDFGLKVKEPEFNIFVIGEDRTGRLNATLDYIQSYSATQEPVDDWVYLYNFENPQEPLPFRFPNGKAREFCKTMKKFIQRFAMTLLKSFNSETFMRKLQKPAKEVEEEIQQQLEELRAYSLQYDIDIARNPDGTIAPIHVLEGEKKRKKKKKLEPPANVWDIVTERLQSISLYAEYEAEKINDQIEKLKQKEAEKILKPLTQQYLDKYREIQCIQPWLTDLNGDIIQNLDWFVQERGVEEALDEESLLNRYSVNVFVQSPKDQPPLIVEPNPTYENLFGTITYKNTASGYNTNFTMISPGSLHRANGGVLIIRADALAMNPESWKYLKDALRDRVIRTEELHRTNAIPMLEAPRPKPIPLDMKVVVIGSPLWFYNYFYADQDFMTYFKIKADISPHFDASPKNISTMAKLLQAQTTANTELTCSKRAMSYILGYSTRFSGSRRKLSAHFEALMDIIYEAGSMARSEKSTQIHLQNVLDAIASRDKRNSLMLEESVNMMTEGVVKISTKGKKIGQINGLTVQEVGGYSFGTPSRITAQSSIGKKGVVNIEHVVEMSGSILHKGVLILEGFLRGTFAQDYPLSCSCSITFEQTYVGVDGDSASGAELCAILSSLSDTPLRQDIAITGAINQFGDIQAIGGVNEKIEGFFRVCKKRGLSGDQGVIIPQSNEQNLTLTPEVTEAVEKGTFHIWSIKHLTEALDLLTEEGSKHVFKETEKTLQKFDQALTKRKSA